MSITVKLEGLDDMLAMFEPQQYRDAAKNAMDKLAAQGKTEASRVIRSKYNIKKYDLDSKISVERARSDNLLAVLRATGRPIDLTYFGAKQVTAQNRLITRSTGRQLKRASKIGMGVTVQILKNGPPTYLPHAFIATMPNGKIGVFRRTGKGREIANVAMVTIATLFGGKTTTEGMTALIQEKWPGIFKNSVEYIGKKSR